MFLGPPDVLVGTHVVLVGPLVLVVPPVVLVGPLVMLVKPAMWPEMMSQLYHKEFLLRQGVAPTSTR